jgi:hypothetical protein
MKGTATLEGERDDDEYCECMDCLAEELKGLIRDSDGYVETFKFSDTEKVY